jgi:hypothetical protein
MMVAGIFAAKHHPEQGLRAGLGMQPLARRYGCDRLEAASARGLERGVKSYGSILSILENTLDRAAAPDEAATHSLGAHDNVSDPAPLFRSADLSSLCRPSLPAMTRNLAA